MADEVLEGIVLDRNYYDQLAQQVQVNEEQIEKLQDLLFIQKLKATFYLGVAAFIAVALGAIIFALLNDYRFGTVERYTAIFNIAAVFLFFGLVEMFAISIASLTLVRDARRLLTRHVSGLKAAYAELAVD